VKVLELAAREGFSSPEMTELLEMARAAATERITQDLVERSFIEAKRLLQEQNYEAVLTLLPPVLQRVEEPSLRRQLEEATRNQAKLEERVEQVMSEVRILCEAELFDSAIGLIGAEQPGVQRAKSVEALHRSCREKMSAEAARLGLIGRAYACLENSECPEGFQQVISTGTIKKPVESTSELEKRATARVQLFADEQMKKSVETAKQTLAAEDALGADSQLQNCSAWLPYASAGVQAEWKSAQAEVAGAKKVLRFRKVLGRRA